MVYEYYVPEFGKSPEDANTFTYICDHPCDSWIAQRICEKNYSCDWNYYVPEVLMARKQGDSEWLKFELEVESQPVFRAWKAD